MCKKCGVFAVHSTCRLVGDTPGSTAPTAHTRPAAWGYPCLYVPHAPRCHRCTQACHVGSVCRQAGSLGVGGHGRLQAWTGELCWGYTRPCPALGHGAGAVSPRHPSLGPRGLKATFSDLTSSCQRQGCLVLPSSPLPGSGQAVPCAVLGPIAGPGRGLGSEPLQLCAAPPTCTAGFSSCAGAWLGITLWHLGAILWEGGVAAVGA